MEGRHDELARRLPRQSQAPPTAGAAKERLQIVLAHERISRTGEDFLPKLQKDLLEVISKYVAIDAKAVNVSLDRGRHVHPGHRGGTARPEGGATSAGGILNVTGRPVPPVRMTAGAQPWQARLCCGQIIVTLKVRTAAGSACGRTGRHG
ncbi:cell division topological specificity factor MinE [Pseudoroseomonas wenyumeiae]